MKNQINYKKIDEINNFSILFENKVKETINNNKNKKLFFNEKKEFIIKKFEFFQVNIVLKFIIISFLSLGFIFLIIFLIKCFWKKRTKQIGNENKRTIKSPKYVKSNFLSTNEKENNSNKKLRKSNIKIIEDNAKLCSLKLDEIDNDFSIKSEKFEINSENFENSMSSKESKFESKNIIGGDLQIDFSPKIFQEK